MLDWPTIITFVITALVLLVLSVNKPRKQIHEDAVVVVTGGSSGIGLAYAESVVRSSSPKRIVLLARNLKTLEEAKQRVNDARKSSDTIVDIIVCDVSSDKDCAMIGEKLGEVDILVNCAGVSYPTEMEKLKVSEIQTMVNTNLYGSIYLTRHLIPFMKKKKSGVIVFVASQAAQCGLYGYTVYSATKFALRGLAEALQMEVAPFNISVCVSYPPDTDTEAYRKENAIKPAATRLMSEGSLMKPEQVAETMRRGIDRKDFSIWSNFDGFMLSQLTCGFAPANDAWNLVYQIPLMGIMRIVSFVYRTYFASIVRKCLDAESRISSRA
jgi:3-dehydrosphinganine reductase